ncbi:MAG TPA: response regulator transcription factor [Actinomycetes bacterium]|jgi:DNA-binding NarL/FixJ family response regulator|nr:response regulator transcription factor [Actinomycetes bacterium]
MTRRPRVLVVEDHPAVRGALVALLEVIGFQVVGVAVDGVDAVALARQAAPELVLMDLSLPVLNGLDATRLLREALPATPVVVLTAIADQELERAASAAGAAGYLVKGCSAEQLRQVLGGAIAATSRGDRDR